MKNENRGTSLIELIIIMAILAVLACSVGLGVSMISGKPAEQCASKIKSILQTDRVTTMGKYEAKVKIYATVYGGLIVVEEVNGTSKTTILAKKDITVQFKDNEGNVMPLGNIADPLIIQFDRSSGALKDLSEMGLGGKYCAEIIISKGSKIKTLELNHFTGKISLY